MRSDLIFDLGLHHGEDTEFYLKKGFSVVAVEANPLLASAVAERLASYVKTGQLNIVNKAIARDEGPITFFASDVTIWGTTDPSWAERNRRLGAAVEETTVDGIRFSRLLKEHGVPYFMKIDIEGADTLCLEGLLESDDRPKFVSIESCKTSFDDLVAEFALFQQLGYKKYKIVPQHKVERQRLPRHPLEGKFVEHPFQEGSSGAFGLELPGEWLSLEDALKAYMVIFWRYRLTGDAGSLSSIGAVRNVLNAAREQRPSSAKTLARKIVRSVGSWLDLRPGWYDTHGMLG